MSKLLFKSNYVSGVIIPAVSETITNLNDTVSVLSSAKNPKNCNIDVESLKTEISDTIDQLKKLKIWLERSVEVLTSEENRQNNNAGYLPVLLSNVRIEKIKE